MNISVNSNTGLYDINSGINNTQNIAETEGVQQRTASVPADAIRYVKAGDTFSGQILGMNDDGTVSLLLGDNTKLNAFLSKNLGLTPGQTLSFTVSGASESKISLTPLYANLDGNSAVGKALNEAGLPLTKGNSDMVMSMMERGLPIDSKSLQSMAYEASKFPLADPQTIVQMRELQIPLNEGNIKEFEAYKDNQYKILDSFETLSDGFTEIAGKSVKDNNEVIKLFLGESDLPYKGALEKAVDGDFTDAAKLLDLDPKELKALDISLKENTDVPTDGKTVMPDAEGGKEAVTDSGKEVITEGGKTPGADSLKTPVSDTLKTPNGETGKLPVSGESSDAVISKQPPKDLTGHVTDDLNTLLGREGVKKLAENMKAAGLPEALAAKVSDGSISADDSLKFAKALIDRENLPSELQQSARTLLQSREYKMLLHNGITNEFLLKPEDVADKEKVREYYEKVVKNSDKALEFLNNSGRGSTSLAQGMNNLRNNVDFMNQLNNVMTYLQLPLKMNEDKAHGDLYVYTNKKNLAKKDGNVSALLHLDMQHLGTMDIHVQMTDYENVKTHFILQKEEMLDFIGEHLHELDAAINKRGYNMHSDVSLNKEARDVPDIMFNRGTNEKLIQTTSFDIRA